MLQQNTSPTDKPLRATATPQIRAPAGKATTAETIPGHMHPTTSA